MPASLTGLIVEVVGENIFKWLVTGIVYAKNKTLTFHAGAKKYWVTQRVRLRRLEKGRQWGHGSQAARLEQLSDFM